MGMSSYKTLHNNSKDIPLLIIGCWPTRWDEFLVENLPKFRKIINNNLTFVWTSWSFFDHGEFGVCQCDGLRILALIVLDQNFASSAIVRCSRLILFRLTRVNNLEENLGCSSSHVDLIWMYMLANPTQHIQIFNHLVLSFSVADNFRNPCTVYSSVASLPDLWLSSTDSWHTLKYLNYSM